MQFSYFDRPELIRELSAEVFDLLIIGGGITGAGIALDAASRGLRTALIEKEDFAYGTSSRSTKLIHGGLRYLKQFEFGLVKEVGSERAIVHHLAPHLVIPEKMLLPLTSRSMGAMLTSIGLKIYDWLAGVKREDRRKMLTRPQIFKYEPLLRREGVKGGAIYAEYRTDDARLTIEIAKTAAQKGAVLLNHCKAVDFIYTDDRVAGVRAQDELTHTELNITSAVVVNAGGPWVDQLRYLNHATTGKRLHLTKGVHLVVPHTKLPVRQAIYFDVSDGRMIFAIPRGRCTYIGTTDTDYAGDIDAVTTTKEDAQYLINAVNDTFPASSLSLADVESSWAGLRPLIHEEGKSPEELSRKDEIFVSPSGLISIAGGKLTGYRKMAERVVDRVIHSHFKDRQFEPCRTDILLLNGNAFEDYREVTAFHRKVKGKLIQEGLPPMYASYMVQNYGDQCQNIIEALNARPEQDRELALLLAELHFCLDREMVCTLMDFCMRRTGRVFFHISSVMKYKEALADEMGRSLQWNAEQQEQALSTLNGVLHDASQIQ